MFGTVRTVAVQYRADVDGYMAGVRRMQSATADFGKRAVSTAKSQSAEWDSTANTMLIAGTAIAAGLGYVVKTTADYEAAMSQVAAVSDASSTQMTALSEAALQAGEDTVFSATEAAGAQAELAKAGVSTADILGGALKGSLDLAAAGGIEVADAAEIAAQSMNLFGLEGDDVSHIADVLTAAANKSAAGVDDLGQALQQGGTVAASTGLSLEETAGTLAAFADAGIKGSDAGTSMKTMLQRLNPTSKEAADTMKSLGINAYDAQGNFIGMDKLAGQLQTSMSGLTDEQRNAAMATIFGSDAVRGANILYQQGEAGIREYIAAVNDQGAAARMAARMTDNLKGDLEGLGGALETAFIKSGSGGTEALRNVVQGIESVIGAYNDLPPSAQSAAFNVAAVTAALLLVGGGSMKAITAIAGTKDALKALGVTAGTTSKAVAGLQAALAVLAVAWGAVEIRDWVKSQEQADVSTRALSEGLLALGSGATEAEAGLADLFRQHDQGLSEMFRGEEQFVSSAEAIERFAFQANEATRTDLEGTIARWMEGTSAFEKSVATADAALAEMVKTGDRAAAQKAFEKLMSGVDPENVEEVRAQFELFQKALDETGPAAGAVREAMGGLDDAIDTNKDGWVTATEEVEAHQKALDELRSAIEMIGGGLRAERAAQREFAAAVKESADIASLSAAEQDAALDSMVQSALDVAAAQIEMGRSSDVVAADLAVARKAYIDAGVAAGKSRPYMNQLADAMGLIPENVKTMISQAGAGQAKAEVLSLDTQIELLNGKTVSVKEAGALAAKGRVKGLEYQITDLNGKTVTVKEIGATASGNRVVIMDGKIRVLRGKTVDVNERGAAPSRDRVSLLDVAIGRVPNKTVGVRANVSGESQVRSLNSAINSLRDRNIHIGTYRTTYRKTVAMGTVKAAYADGGIAEQAGAGLHQYMADGGVASFAGQMPHIRAAGGAGVTWAEEGAGPWEAWISGHPAKAGRSRDLVGEVAARLGGAVVWPTKMADGGTRDYRHYSAPSPAPVVVQAPTAQGGSALVGGDLVLQSSGDTREDMAEAMFQLRRIKRGGL